MDASEITAVVLTRDEERNLPRALTSLPHGCAILVLDACSDDRTAEHARGAGARVIERPWTDFVDARRYALAQVTTPWTLMLDADEALDDVLRGAIAAADGVADAYVIRRTTYYRGKPMRMWSGEPLVRLVRTGAARVEARPASGGNAALHERLVCTGTNAELDGTLLHFSYPDAASYRSKFARYTRIEAEGRPRSLAALLREGVLLVPRFANYLLRRGALLDGPRGWTIAWYSALYPLAVAWRCRG